MKHLTWPAVLVLTGVCVGCAPVSKEAKRELRQPVNCATAQGDIRILGHEKAHVGKQIASGVPAITPAGAVIGIVTGTEREKFTVATGDYNKQIDAKIAEIKRVCGI